ncbi:MAG: tetratricopeptide repeat protein [Planctomycetaceae bacterium]
MRVADPITAAKVARPCQGARRHAPLGAVPALVSAALVCLAVAGAAGCRLVQSSGAAPRRLAEARRLSSEGLAAVGQQDYAGAETLLAEAVKRCPSDAEARRHYAAVLWQRGERPAARAQIEEGLRIAPDDGATLLAGGRMALEMGLLDDADRMADAALRATPRSAEVWHLHGRVALARGRHEEALADFHRGLALAPDDRALLLDAAETYRHLGLPQRALATLAHLSDSYGPAATPGLVLGLEGMAQEALGRTDEACESYRAALSRGGAPADTAERLANLTAAGPAGAAATGLSRRSSSVR